VAGIACIGVDIHVDILVTREGNPNILPSIHVLEKSVELVAVTLSKIYCKKGLRDDSIANIE
jgi:hypothetical protein